MGLCTIFGINGIGKDTIAEELRKKNQGIEVTSMSRLLMFILGISKTYDAREKISERQYNTLENIPQSKMIDIENNEYKELIEKISKSDKDVIILAHLISALRLGKEVKFLEDRKTPGWFVDMNKKLIQLTAPPQLISERRQKDQRRIRGYEVAKIVEHQKLCDKEWERIREKDSYSRQKMFIVENIELNKAVNDIEEIIFDRKKAKSTSASRSQFVQNLKFETDNIYIKNNSIKSKEERGRDDGR